MTVILALAASTLLVLLVARYGADSRTGSDPTGRDPAWPAGPAHEHTPAGDLRALRRLARAGLAHLRAAHALERRQYVWSAPARTLTPRW